MLLTTNNFLIICEYATIDIVYTLLKLRPIKDKYVKELNIDKIRNILKYENIFYHGRPRYDDEKEWIKTPLYQLYDHKPCHISLKYEFQNDKCYRCWYQNDKLLTSLDIDNYEKFDKLDCCLVQEYLVDLTIYYFVNFKNCGNFIHHLLYTKIPNGYTIEHTWYKIKEYEIVRDYEELYDFYDRYTPQGDYSVKFYLNKTIINDNCYYDRECAWHQLCITLGDYKDNCEYKTLNLYNNTLVKDFLLKD